MHFHVGSDHAGVSMRRTVVNHLRSLGHDVAEVGPSDGEKSDYPDLARTVSETVARKGGLGVLICGTGIGVSIAANKVAGVRAALVHDPVTARLAREHNDANVLCLGARLLAEPYAVALVDAWLGASFEARHQGRLDKIAALERSTLEY
jgi:ribose 5-phosphate isomerase B